MEDPVLCPPGREGWVPSGSYLLSPRLGGRQPVEGFFLDRHLVTVARYRRFMEAGGYQDERYWDPEGWRMITTYRLTAPRFWGEARWRRFQRDDRPIVGASWWEARAFCRYEGRRLPTEREWEAAARGPAGFRYPWGPEWDEARVGVRGKGPRLTWPVGFFHRAKGPFGHHDLVGNVWQWTDDPSIPGQADSPRIVRGGSWASRPDQNDTETWNAYDRGGQFSHLGFRTAASARAAPE